MVDNTNRAVLLAVLLTFISFVIVMVSLTITEGNAMGSKALNEFSMTATYVTDASLDELKYSANYELPTAAAFNFLEHYESCVGNVVCSKCGSYHVSEGICLLNHMKGRVKMTVTDSVEYYGLYDVRLDVL